MSAREVTLDGGGPWGFRMHGGADTKQPLRISRVNPGSKAAQRGIREADLISSINGQSTRNATNADAHAMLKNAGETLRLGLNEDTLGSPKKRMYRSVQETRTETIKHSTVSSVTAVSGDSLETSPIKRVLASVHGDKASSSEGESRDSKKTINDKPAAEPSRVQYDYSVDRGTRTSVDVDDDRQSLSPPLQGVITSLDVSVRLANEQTVNNNNNHPNIRNPSTSSDTVDTANVRYTDVNSEVQIAATCDNTNSTQSNRQTLTMSDNISNNIGPLRKRRSRNNRKKGKNKNNSNGNGAEELPKNIESEAQTEVQILNDKRDVSSEISDVVEQSDKCFKPISDEDIEEALTNTASMSVVVNKSELVLNTLPKMLMSEVVCENYRVESPQTVVPVKLPKPMLPKSRSLDDDELLQITEIDRESDVETEDKSKAICESTAIVSEAESEVEWETADDLVFEEPYEETSGILSYTSISLNDSKCRGDMSSEDEETLRDFLGSLNLTTVDNVAKQTTPKPGETKQTTNEAKAKRARKRAALESHFMPQYLNPRFLDVIQEEGSDASDSSKKRISGEMQPGTLIENREWLKQQDDDLDDDVFVEERSKEPKEHFPKPKVAQMLNRETGEMMYIKSNRFKREQPECVLLGTRIVDGDTKSGCGSWTTTVLEEPSGAEVVYLDDTSSNSSVVDHEENADDADIEEEDDDDREIKLLTPTIEINSVNSEINISDNDITNGLCVVDSRTPPPSPESSPKGSTSANNSLKEPLSEDAVSFIKNLLSVLSNEPNVEKVIQDLNVETLSPELQAAINDVIARHKAKRHEENERTLNANCVVQVNGTPETNMDDDKVVVKNNNEEIPEAETTGSVEPSSEYLEGNSGSVNISPTSFGRQDSSGSLCSSHSTSQSTTKYCPLSSSLTDIAGIINDDGCENDLTQSVSETPDLTTATTADSVLQPESLRHLCVETVVALPFGAEILEELASVSESIESMTCRADPRKMLQEKLNEKEIVYPVPDVNNIAVASADKHDSSSLILVSSPSPLSQYKTAWVGVPTEHDPQLLLCLSPSQRNYINENKSHSTDNADALIDLHRKYIERRGYHETDNMRTMTSEHRHSAQKPVSVGETCKIEPERNRLLAIIRGSSDNPECVASSVVNNEAGIPTPPEVTMPQRRESFNSDNEVFVCEDRIKHLYKNELKRAQMSQADNTTLPTFNKRASAGDESRLKATNLSDWMYFARRNSFDGGTSAKPSTPNSNGKSTDGNVTRLIPIEIEQTSRNNTARTTQTSRSHDVLQNLSSLNERRSRLHSSPVVEPLRTGVNMNNNIVLDRQRRYSLPRNLHEQQMLYILEKEKEIQREIEELEKEKHLLYLEELESNKDVESNVRDTRKSFDTENYHISKKGDIAVMNSNSGSTRPKSMPVTSSIQEKVRQEMYSEYMSKIAEREERKHHKVIKISRPVSMPEEATREFNCEVQHVNKIENEFMDKVKERKDKLGIRDNEIESGTESQTEESKSKTNGNVIDDKSNVCVLEGDGVADVHRLPPHLREFVEFTSEEVSSRTEISHGFERRDRRRYGTSPNNCDGNKRISANDNGLLEEIDDSLVLARGFLLAREPVMFAPTFKAKAPAAGVWSPNNSKSSDSTKNTEKIITVEKSTTKTTKSGEEPPPLPVWSPSSAGPSPTAERKEFRPLKFESPVLSRKSLPKAENSSTPEAPVSPPWQQTESIASSLSASLDRRLTSSQSAPGGSLNTLSGTRLPRAQNPTITLLQKAREGQLPRGASYLEENQKIPKDTKPGIIAPNEIIYTVKSEYTSEPETEREKPKKMADLGPRKFEGIGPTTKDGMPIVLRSEVKESNQAKWYKRMYDTLHKAKNDDEYVTVRYKTRRGLRYPYSGNGYLSEPEPQGYDSDVNVKYNTLDRRRAPSVGAAPDHSSTMPRLSRSHVKYETDVYRNQPGRIEDYVPGHSSISERETKEWWDEVMDIFDGWLDDNSPLPQYNVLLARAMQRRHLEQQKRVPTINPRSYMSHALKESGYESDSQLIFRRRDDTAQQLSPVEQRQAYKSLQAGGDPPLQGFRKPAPERPKDDSDIEYFPISPTLTRIRIHKNSVKPPKEINCFPITKVPSPSTNVFSKYEQHTSSYLQVTPPNPPPLPPSPPNRRSSKHNNTLRLYSTVKVSSSQSPGRHESCFTTETDKSNVQFLKDRLTYKLSSNSPRLSRKSQTEECQRYKSRNVSVSPISRICNTSNGKKTGDKTKLSKKVCDLHLYRRVSSPSPMSRPLKTDTFTRRTTPSPVAFGRAVSSERTFASEKRKLESAGKLKRDDTPTRIMRSPELTSPKEVKKVLQNQKNAKITTNRTVKHLPPGTTVKSSTTLYSSTRNGSKHSPKTDEKALRVTVAISARGKELLRASTETPKFCRSSRTSAPRVVSPVVTKSTVKKCCRSELSPSPLSSRSRFKSTSSLPTSFRSLSRDSKVSVSSETGRRLIRTTTSETKRRVEKYGPVIAKPVTITKSSASKGEPFQIIGKVKQNSDKEKKKAKKNKKDEKKLNGKSKLNGDKRKTKKCAGRAAGSEIVKELKKMESSVETSSFGSFENLLADEIHQQREAIRSDSFFQNLFLRDISPTPSMASSLYRNTSVLEKARMWNNLSYKSEPSLRQTNVYLSQKKPVTESKFRNLDRESQPLSRASSRGVSWPGRHVATQIQKFDSLRGFEDEEDEFGSNVVYRARSPEINEVLKERSKSEPPPKTVLTETVRPHSPVVRRSSPDHSRKSLSPSPIRSPAYRRIHNARLAQHKNAECVETSKRKTVRARSEGDADLVTDYTESQILSTAQSANSLNTTKIAEHQEYQAYVTELVHSNRKSNRFRELNKFYENLQRVGELERATSSSDLRPRRKDEEIIDFDRWKQVRAQERAEHELNMLYGKLKTAQKEKDLLFRPHDAELIKWKRDRDRGLRIKEKSVEDLKDHFQKLSVEESDLEASRRREIEARKDVYKPLWRGNSVVNLATSMVEKRNPPATRERIKSTPTRQEKVTGMHGYHISSRLWSSLSVDQVNTLKNQLSEIYSNGSPKQIEKEEEDIKEYVITVPPNIKQMDTSLHVRSSSLLTKDQMFAPSTSKQETKRALKAESIGSINMASVSTTEKCETSKKDPSLSEGEKRRISQTLSQEIMNKISQRSQARSPIVLAKETRGAIAAASARLPGPDTSSPRTCYSLEMSEDGNISPTRRTFKEKTDFVLVLTPKEDVVQHKKEIKEVLDEWAQPKTSSVEQTVTTSAATATTTVRQTSTTSETESASSETSNRTVIYCPPSEVKSKVDYFEKAKQEQSVGTVIYHARDDSSPEATPTVEITEVVVEPPPVEKKLKTKKPDAHFGRLVPSQSVADFKELYGEREIYKLATTPLSSRFKTDSRSESMSPDRKHVEFSPRTDNISPMRGLSNGSSFDSIYRSRSTSPDPERYWRAYLNLVKTGDVRRLKDKFEYCDEHAGFASLRPRRINSDPELTRTLLNKRGTKSNRVTIREQETVDVGRMAWKYETRCSRGRTRTRRGRVVSPIPKIPLRPEDRFMPHINVISKLASLSPRSATVPSRKTGQKIASMLGCQTGEVEKIKDKFEKRDRNMSIMGQMFTSTPDMHELRDIAPYLAASWAAHQYPRRQDNSRSLSSPETLPKDAEVPIKKERQRPKSTSPPRPKQKPLSILKPQTSKSNVFAHQPFNASIHRPKYRYQPDAPKIQSGTWWPKLPVYPAKPSVTFKEPDVAPPPPPPKGVPMTGDYRSESPRRYVDSEVTIHYRSPVRHETKDALPEEELARRQAEAMRRIYQEERRRKYLQELQDMNSRRHTDNFIPSQKSPIPLNRYDDLTDDLTFRTTKITRGSPEPRLVAKALYNFVGQTSRELSFKKGDIIFVRRQVDKNWYEGEHNAMIGLFPFNYVEIIPYEGIRTTPRKLSEGQARAKFNFIAQTALELSLLKGELVTLTRRVDDNWFEGKIANRKGIFPVSYVEILSDVGERIEPKTITSSKPVASPAAHSLLVNGSSGGKQSMGQHHYTPQYNPSGTHHARPASAGPVGSPAGYGSLPRGGKEVHQTLHVDTHSEAVPYRALYKYRPQNSDELELVEGDTVFVLEKCDDGWYVGSSQRTGCFGTFPGNYVERL